MIENLIDIMYEMIMYGVDIMYEMNMYEAVPSEIKIYIYIKFVCYLIL